MNNPHQHILILTPGFAADKNDLRAVPYLRVFLEALTQKYPSLKISIVAFQYPYEKKQWIWDGINVYSCGGGNRSFPFRLIDWVRIWRTIKKINSKNPVDIIQSYWLTECALIGNFTSKRLGKPHYSTSMGQDALQNNNYLKRVVNSKYLKQVVALSKNHNEILKRNSGINAGIIPFGVNESSNVDIQNERPIDILGVGALTTLKDYKSFIELVARLKNNNLVIKIIGDGPEKEILKKLSSELGISAQVEFLGNLNHDKVLELMQQAKVLLHPSKFEGMGYVFAEALYSGMKVVSRKVGHQIEHSNWYVGQTNDQLFLGLSRFMQSPFQAQSIEVYKMEDTIKSYLEMWEVSINE